MDVGSFGGAFTGPPVDDSPVELSGTAGTDDSASDGSDGDSGSTQPTRTIAGPFSALDGWTATGDVSTGATSATLRSDAPTRGDSGDDGGGGGDAGSGSGGDDGGSGDGGDDSGGDDGSSDGDGGDDTGNDPPPDLCGTFGCVTPTTIVADEGQGSSGPTIKAPSQRGTRDGSTNGASVGSDGSVADGNDTATNGTVENATTSNAAVNGTTVAGSDIGTSDGDTISRVSESTSASITALGRMRAEDSSHEGISRLGLASAGTSESFAPLSTDGTTTTLEREVSVDPDAVEVVVTVRVSGDATADRDSRAQAVLRTPGTDRTLLDLDGESSGIVARDVTLDSIAGQTVTFDFRASDGASLTVHAVDVEVRYDSDGDGLTDTAETGGFRIGTGERTYTDPYDADTDRDGIEDGRELGREVTTDGRSYYLLDSDPTAVDSDGDDLSDYEERYERQSYTATTSRAASVDLLQAEGPDEMQESLSEGTTRTDPMRPDTDGDGLDDDREVILSTNPSNVNTDGDGIFDGREVKRWETDPTLHDYRPPEVTVTSAKFETPGCSSDGCDADAEYAIRYRAKDPSGVSRVEFVKQGDVQETVTPAGRAQTLGGRVVFTTGFLESSADAVTGTTVDIEATDTHGAATRQTALERQNFYGNLAGELDRENVYTVAAASELARISGFASSYGAPVRGAKQSAEGVPAFLRTLSEDPLAVLEGVTEILRVMEKYGILDTLVEAFAGPLQEKQETNNPYSESENPELYRVYKISWYQGYAGGKATQVVLGAGAAKAVTKSAKVRKLDDSLSGRSNSYRALKSVKQRKDAAEAVAATKVLRGTARVGSGTLRGARTVGSKVKVWRLSRRAGLDGRDKSDYQ